MQSHKSEVKLPQEFHNKCNISTSNVDFDYSFLEPILISMIFIELKASLLTEFGTQINSVENHEILSHQHIIENRIF